jgi:hypothetical protein
MDAQRPSSLLSIPCALESFDVLMEKAVPFVIDLKMTPLCKNNEVK